MGSGRQRAVGALLAVALVATVAAGLAMGGAAGGAGSSHVSKWGVEVEVTGDELDVEYLEGGLSSNVGGDAVVSGVTGGAVAPGARGPLGGVRVSGAPSVTMRVVASADVELSGWDVAPDGGFYCPLVITVGRGTIRGLDYSWPGGRGKAGPRGGRRGGHRGGRLARPPGRGGAGLGRRRRHLRLGVADR